ncbi:MAG: GNAT family N-acetyltransferase [Campylobacterota bacterium]
MQNLECNSIEEVRENIDSIDKQIDEPIAQRDNKRFQWHYDTNNVDWDELSNLYKIAPLGDKKPEDLKIVFENSRYKCFVYDKDKLVGVGRALADGVDVSYIADVAIHPEYQGLGLGKDIVNKLVEFSKDHNKIILFASMGKEPFYSKLGFDKMNTAMAIFKNRQRVLDMGLVSKLKY